MIRKSSLYTSVPGHMFSLLRSAISQNMSSTLQILTFSCLYKIVWHLSKITTKIWYMYEGDILSVYLFRLPLLVLPYHFVLHFDHIHQYSILKWRFLVDYQFSLASHQLFLHSVQNLCGMVCQIRAVSCISDDVCCFVGDDAAQGDSK